MSEQKDRRSDVEPPFVVGQRVRYAGSPWRGTVKNVNGKNVTVAYDDLWNKHVVVEQATNLRHVDGGGPDDR